MRTAVRLESSKSLTGFRVLRIGPVNMGLRVHSAEPLGRMTEQLIHMLLIGAEHQIFSGSIRHMLPEHDVQPIRHFQLPAQSVQVYLGRIPRRP